MARAARDRAGTVSRLAEAEKKADALASRSRQALDRQQTPPRGSGNSGTTSR